MRCLAVIQIPKCEEEVLQAVLSRAEFRIEIWSFDRSQNDEQPNAPVEPVKDLIYSIQVPHIEDPTVLAQQSTDDTTPDFLTLVWEVEVVLHRPRIRMPDPSIYAHSVLLISPSASESSKSEHFLEPFGATEPNVLEPLQRLPTFNGKPPYLAASRLERVMPVAPKPSNHFRIEHMSPKYRIVPAAIARMRFTRLNSSATTPATIASLDLEMIPFIEIEATIEKVDMQIANGQIEDLMPDFVPMDCRSRDSITFLHRLQPAAGPSVSSTPLTPTSLANLDVLTISIRIRLTTSDKCESMILMDWTTNVDFFQALNPSFGAPSQPLQRTHRPQTLSLGNGANKQSQTINTSLQPILPTATSDNVTISFISPAEPVQLGKAFAWRVLIVNRTPQQAKITLIPLPRILRAAPPTSHFQKRHAPKSSTASFHPTERRHVRDPDSDVEFAQAIVDENVVYAMQHSNLVLPETDLMSLTAEVRIGPLGPGQCHETEISMVAFKAGVLRVDAMRVIDNIKEVEEGINASGVMTDIRDLPDVVVEVAGDSHAMID